MKGLNFSLVLMCFMATTAIAQQEHYTVTQTLQPRVIKLDGVVQAVNQGTVAAQTSGRVVGVYVDVNDYVKQDTVLLEISAVQQSAMLDSAQAQLVQAKAQNRVAQAQLKRLELLFPKGAVSQDQMDSAVATARSADASVKSAKATVAQAKESLGYTSITAPYDGVVTERLVELGETVAPGTPLLSGFSLDLLRVETQIPQRYQDKVTSVEQFSIVSPNGQRIAAMEMNLFRYAEPNSHTFKIRLTLPLLDNPLLPGMWVKTEFSYGEKPVLLVPKSAVIRRGELSSVLRISSAQQILNPVRLGQSYGDYIEVLAGLEQGDVIASVALAAKESHHE